jgi:hypothetical protein
MEAYEKIEEETMKGATSGGNTSGYGDGAPVEVYGGATVSNKKDQGADDAPKEFDGEGNDNIEDTPENKNDAGAKDAVDSFDGSDGSAGDPNTEKRKAGATNAPDKYETLDGFRNRIRSGFGLPLDAKINKGNSGIQK